MGRLIARELKRFIKSPAVCLNTGFGIIIMLVGIFASFIKTDVLRERVTVMLARVGFESVLPIAAVVIVCFVLTLDCMTASSISLEGEGLPELVAEHGAKRLLAAKGLAQIILNAPFAIANQLALGLVIRSTPEETALMAVLTLEFTVVLAEFGLVMNVNKPMLKWDHEAVPIKQSFAVMYTMVFGWAWVLLFAACGRLLMGVLTPTQTMLAYGGLMLIAIVLLLLMLGKRSAEKLEEIKA